MWIQRAAEKREEGGYQLHTIELTGDTWRARCTCMQQLQPFNKGTKMMHSAGALKLTACISVGPRPQLGWCSCIVDTRAPQHCCALMTHCTHCAHHHLTPVAIPACVCPVSPASVKARYQGARKVKVNALCMRRETRNLSQFSPRRTARCGATK